jgi:hypothetical protein
LKSGEEKAFRQLSIGDQILSATRDGSISYSSVVFLPHRENDRRATFVEVNTASGKTVKLTRGHLLPLCDGSLMVANDIKEGSCLRTVDGEDEVTNTTMVEMNGVYTAVTENEFLVVNGIIASPFAASSALVHAFFNLTDMEDWCASNDWLAFESARHPHIQQEIAKKKKEEEGAGDNVHELMITDPILKKRADPSQDCMDMLEDMFETYKDEPIGWGVEGFGYRNNWVNPASPEEVSKKEKTMAFKLSGWD